MHIHTHCQLVYWVKIEVQHLTQGYLHIRTEGARDQDLTFRLVDPSLSHLSHSHF